MASAHPPARLAHLDMIRGLAALEVCVAHARAFFLVDYDQSGRGLVASAFYLLTGIHHEAVMIFFVLSGYLVGGGVVRDHRLGRFSVSAYSVRRLSRLWVVMVPALLLTLAWDSLGTAINPAGYAGSSYQRILSGPSVATQPSLIAFVGNLAFLQTIAVPVFGSNGPLWSLASEFWFYVLFPLAMLALLGRPPATRVGAAALAAILIFWLPSGLLKLGSVWLMGTVAYCVRYLPKLERWLMRPLVGVSALLALLALLAASRLHWPWTDYAIGGCFALAVPFLAAARAPDSLYYRAAVALSEVSYTLYLVHFPFLTAIYFTLIDPTQLRFSPASVAVLIGIVGATLIYAWAVWWLFERRSVQIRSWIERWLRSTARPPNSPPS